MRISDGVQTCALPISPRCKKRIPRKVRTYAAFLVGSSERFEHLACLLELTTQLVDSRCSHVPCSDDDGLDSLDCGGLTQLADSSLDRIGCDRNCFARTLGALCDRHAPVVVRAGMDGDADTGRQFLRTLDRKSTRLNSSH